MDAAKLFEGIALLIDLAQRGEIDPWDVQVIDVIDRYLSKLVLESAQAAYEADLSQSGQAFLSASMLVLFKANTLVAIESPVAPAEDVLLETDGVRRRLPLEQQLHRRPTALPPQKRRVTLQELIDQLKLMATALQLQSEVIATNTRKSHFRSHSRAQALQALELAHQENLTEVARELEQVLNRHTHRLEQEDWLDLEQLIFWLQTTNSEILSAKSNPDASTPGNAARVHAGQPHDRVSVFSALLLLSAQSKVELCQEEFYQEIKIRTLRDLPSGDRDRSQESTGVLSDSVD